MLAKGINMLQEDYDRNRSYTDIPYWLGQDHIWRGEILNKAGDSRQALREYRSGAASLESLSNAGVSLNTRCDLAASYSKIAAALALTGDHQQASVYYSKALQIAEPLGSANPPNILALYAVADAYFGMAELLTSARQSGSGESGKRGRLLSQACECYRKSADAWRQIPNPAHITPTGFAVGDPDTVATKLRRCAAESLGSAVSYR